MQFLLVKIYTCLAKTKLLIAAVCLAHISLAVFSDKSHAQSLSIGYKKYTRGDFRGAESALKAASKRRGLKPKAKAQIYKYLGISQYMLKKTRNSQSSFQRAIAANPSTTISSNEVLDERVIGFFNTIKSKMVKRTRARRSKPKSAIPSVVTKTTYLVIKSNVKTATLTVDGILAGDVGSLIEAEPGIVTIQLTARGYVSKKAKLRVLANRKNTYTITLQKPKPKPKPMAKSSPKKRRIQPKANKPRAKGVYLPNPGNDLFSESEEALPPAAPVPQPQYQAPQPYSPVQPYQQQQPAYNPYGLTNPYGQPAYPYPTQPYAPAPAPVYPQASPYAPAPYAPPAYTAPVAPPPAATTPAPLPIPEMDGYDSSSSDFLKSPKKSSKRKKRRPRKKRKSRSSAEPNILISLLPFGAGQFQNGKDWLGGAFLAAEAFAIYWYWTNKSDADQAVTEAEEYFQRDDVTDEQKEEFESLTASYVSKKRSQQQMGLYGFLGLWAAGVGEAIFNAPKPVKKKKRRSKKSRRFLNDYRPNLDLRYSSLSLPPTKNLESSEEFDIRDYRLDDQNSEDNTITPDYETNENHTLGFNYSNPEIQDAPGLESQTEDQLPDNSATEDRLDTLEPEEDFSEDFSYRNKLPPPRVNIGIVYDEDAILKQKQISPYLGVKMEWGF